jgi:GNAT superfamily N-acetyltransferase
MDQIDLIERLAATAWPAEHIEYRGGWRLRSAGAPSRRVNSVLPLGPTPEGPLADRIAEVEAFYRSRGRRARFQVSPAAEPEQLDPLLAARGYGIDAAVVVQTAAVASIAESAVVGQARLDRRADALWMAICWPDGTIADMANRRALLDRIRPEHRFALVSREGEPAAVGLGVLEAEWLGIFCMRTVSRFRRKGAAQAVLAVLARWARELGGQSAYLQVEAENLPALGLYEKARFRAAYTYHYRTESG